MLPENPYQSPESESQSFPAAFTKHPTWKFWALIFLALPGFATQILGYPVEPDLFERVFFGFAAICLVIFPIAIWKQWPTPLVVERLSQRCYFCALVLVFSLLVAFYFGHFTSWIAWLALFGSPNWYYTSQSTRAQILLLGAPGACIPICLGIALAFDAVGRPIRLRSMRTKAGLPRPQ